MDPLITLVILLISAIAHVTAHGRLNEPPARSTAWRFGFDTPINYNDNELNCGGYGNQWVTNDGKCGACGDPWQGPREHEAGGIYATGTIVRSYQKGQIMDAVVNLTTNHKGWFEFRICPQNDPETPVTLECLDSYLLEIADGYGTRLTITTEMKIVNAQLLLPPDVTCTQCVVQWKYNAGNSWGTDPDTGDECMGCGPQEQFYGCADVSIEETNPV